MNHMTRDPKGVSAHGLGTSTIENYQVLFLKMYFF